MKKLMFALIAAALCSNLMAQVLIYDYAASFKRIDVAKNPVKVKQDGITYGLDSAKVASDKFVGWMVIDACYDCSGAMEFSADSGVQNPGNPAVIYVKRNGSKSLAAPYKNALYRAVGRFYAAKFGPKAGVSHDGEVVNSRKFTEALGFLSYNINANGQSVYTPLVKINKPGFMGIGHVGMTIMTYDNWWDDKSPEGLSAHWEEYDNYLLAQDFDTIDHAGFGKTQVLSTELDCLDENSCYVVKNLAGSMVGGFVYQGYCSEFLVDVCDDEETVRLAPIAGTFTLKLNNKMTFSKKEFNYYSYADAEEGIEKASKVAATSRFADPLETAEFNTWMGAAELKDYYYWLNKATGKPVIDDPEKDEYPATEAANLDLGEEGEEEEEEEEEEEL